MMYIANPIVVEYNGIMKKQTFIEPGDRFNRLTAIGYSHTGKHSRRYFVFRCDCGNEITITAEAAISGNTKSCGCIRHDSIVNRYGLIPGQAAMRQVILQYKRHAKDAHREWALTEAQFYEITQRNCFYCGIVPSTVKLSPHGTGNFIYNGIDRMDTSKGYTIDNTVSCCRTCNMAKSDMSIEKFHEWVLRIAAMAEQWGYQL